jgi:hypothetical protein
MGCLDGVKGLVGDLRVVKGLTFVNAPQEFVKATIIEIASDMVGAVYGESAATTTHMVDAPICTYVLKGSRPLLMAPHHHHQGPSVHSSLN